ncbi:WYL domain-containing protein [Desulfosporosinus sp. FKA]|uniref:helix-turn-helix transcriptional regulator n=1 Tax=Desulfosporosinus sp. FKA TaxID=1969834 RepID=UPI000B4A095C|nr:WYL domain-containing protein [Desulfosporosinus sp. FKA]
MDMIERLEKIMALIEAHPEGLTGKALSEACGVPWGTMKQNLRALLFSPEHSIPLYTDHDESNDESGEDLLSPDVKWFMRTAEKRFTPVHLNVREALGVLKALEVLQEENFLIESLKQKILSGFDLGTDEEAYRYIKGDYTPLEPIKGEIFASIENAVQTNRKLNIIFKGRSITVDPLGIVYYSRLRKWYFVARQGDTIKNYNLNNIIEVSETDQVYTYPEGFSLKTWFGPRWGVEYGELIRVKVRFLNRSQTLAKVRKDVAHRKCKLIPKDDGSLIFEDMIIGTNEFINWILGFGSAAEILEPNELRKLIFDQICETLENY